MSKHIPVSEPCLGEEEARRAAACVRSGWISSLGPNITEFESRFAGYCGAPYGVAVANGTVALHLALEVLGVGPGDEVIIPSLTFIAVANAVRYCGARPVCADSDPETWNLDPAAAEKLVTSRTKAVIAVHLYGHPCDMDALRSLCRRRGLRLIEDCAESHGAAYKARMTGSLGDISAFSFYGNKTITLGEGGILLMRGRKLYERALLLRDHGMSKTRRYWHPVVGYNYRITNLQCAVGLAQLGRLPGFVEKKRANAALYNGLLAGVPGVTLPPEKAWARSSYWMYSLLVRDRDALAAFLRANGVDSRPFFVPVHMQPPYRRGAPDCPEARRLAARGINLPSSVKLSRADIRRICSLISGFCTEDKCRKR